MDALLELDDACRRRASTASAERARVRLLRLVFGSTSRGAVVPSGSRRRRRAQLTPEGAAVEVEVLPAQAQQVGPAQAHGEGQHVEGL